MKEIAELLEGIGATLAGVAALIVAIRSHNKDKDK